MPGMKPENDKSLSRLEGEYEDVPSPVHSRREEKEFKHNAVDINGEGSAELSTSKISDAQTERTEPSMSKTDGGNMVYRITLESLVTQIGKNSGVIYTSNQRNEVNDLQSDQASTSSSETTIKRHRKRSKKRRNKQSPGTSKVLQKLGPADPSPSVKTFMIMSDEIMMDLQKLRDNGNWQSFEAKTKELTKEYSGNLDAKTVILLEKSMTACYQNRLTDSEDMLMQATKDAKDSVNSSYLIRRIHLYWSCVYRKQPSQTGSADDHTGIAEQMNDGQILTLDSTFIAYERASIYMEFNAKCLTTNINIKNEAKANFKKCIDGSMILEKDSSHPRYVKKHQFALIKIAMLCLDCRTAAGRKKEVSAADIREASDSLETLRNNYWDGIAEGEKIQYYLAEADLNWRQKRYPEAEKSASMAHNMAIEFGFDTEIEPAKDRLDEIKAKLDPQPVGEFVSGAGAIGMLSGSEFGDLSSSCESDCSCSPLL